MSSVFIGSLASSLFLQTSTTSSEGSSTVHPGPISPSMTLAPVVEISEGVYTLNIKITANPHQRALSVSWIAEMYDVPHLASSILVCWSWVIMVLWLSSGNIILSNFLFPISFLIYGHIFTLQCLASMNSLMMSISLSIAGQLWVGGLHASLQFMLKLILQLLVFIICAFNCAYFTSCFHMMGITKGYHLAKL